MSIAVDIHEVERDTLNHSLLGGGYRDNLVIHLLKCFLVLRELARGSTHEGVDTPVIEDGGTTVMATEALTIHTRLPILLTCVDHKRILLEKG